MTEQEYKAMSIREFTKAAAIYDSGHAGLYEMCKDDYPPVLEELKQYPFQTLLDVGCGTGPMIELLLKKFPDKHCTGIDLTTRMIEAAQAKNLANAKFLVGDSEHLPFEAGAFDVVICTNSFHHDPNPQAFMQEAARAEGRRQAYLAGLHKQPLRPVADEPHRDAAGPSLRAWRRENPQLQRSAGTVRRGRIEGAEAGAAERLPAAPCGGETRTAVRRQAQLCRGAELRPRRGTTETKAGHHPKRAAPCLFTLPDGSIHHGVRGGVAFQRVLLHLDAEVGEFGIAGGGELALGRRGNLQPVARGEGNLFAVDHDVALAGENAVDLLVFLMGVNKRNARTCRQGVQADFGTGQSERVVQLRPIFLCDRRFRIVCHCAYLHFDGLVGQCFIA